MVELLRPDAKSTINRHSGEDLRQCRHAHVLGPTLEAIAGRKTSGDLRLEVMNLQNGDWLVASPHFALAFFRERRRRTAPGLAPDGCHRVSQRAQRILDVTTSVKI